METQFAFDIFCSYKSRHSNQVRAIVDVLIANGLRIWFAEYAISLQQWLNMSDQELDGIITDGIARSERTILFSAPDWHNSPWCQMELRLAERHARKKLINVRMEATPACETLPVEQSNVIDYRAKNLSGTIHAIGKILDRKFSILGLPDPDHAQSVLKAGFYTLSLGHAPLARFDWKWIRGFVWRNGKQTVRAAMFFHPERTTGQIRGMTSEKLGEFSRSSLVNSEDGSEEDRVIYREYARRAARAAGTSGIGVIGLHLFHLRDGPEGNSIQRAGFHGATGFAVTKTESLGTETAMIRDFSVRLWNGPGRRVGEFLMSFDVARPRTDNATALREFCRISGQFERIMNTVVYHGKERRSWHLEAFSCWRMSRHAVMGILALVAGRSLVSSNGSLSQFAVMAILFLGMQGGSWLLREYLTRHGIWPTYKFVKASRVPDEP